jgi:tRNA nucleotidyltransferase (CCA-adding enzyme)
MQRYIVGGWVRDRLLAEQGRAVPWAGDRDWVVVGSTPEELLALGYQPVGRDFPVFLHPQTHEEHALARTERKTAPGYRGFIVHAAPEVTLEEDLQRRDLTINAMAQDEQGGLVDPHGGRADLQARVLRHVGPAFVEDPVRILRLARFAARLADFTVAPETLALARRMVAAGEADALVPERVWQELARGLMEAHPARMLEVLEQAGLLARLAPRLERTPALDAALERSAAAGAALPVRFAVLASAAPLPALLPDWLARIRADGESAQLARLLLESRAALRGTPTVAQRAQLLERADALRRPARFAQLLQAQGLLEGEAGIDAWQRAARAFGALDAGAIARSAGPDPAAIAQALAAARRAAIAEALPGAP